jgi:hypothetical protein
MSKDDAIRGVSLRINDLGDRSLAARPGDCENMSPEDDNDTVSGRQAADL